MANPTGSIYDYFKSYDRSRSSHYEEISRKDIMVNIKFGAFRWDKLPFEKAVNVIENYRKAEMKACTKTLKKINEDHWITSFWSEVLGGAKPPSHYDWIKPYHSLSSAKGAYNGCKFSEARRHLSRAINDYNHVHKKWVTYRDRLDAGASRSITVIEYSMVVLTTAVGGWAGAGRSLFAKSAISAGIKLGTVTATEIGKVVQGVEKKIDFYVIVTESMMAFFTSIVSGKLSEKFLNSIQPEFWRNVLANPKLVEAYKRSNVLLPKQSLIKQYFAEFLTSNTTGVVGDFIKKAILNAAHNVKGRKMNSSQFLTYLADSVMKDRIGKHFGDYVVKVVLRSK